MPADRHTELADRQTHRCTNRRVDHNTPHPHRDGVNICSIRSAMVTTVKGQVTTTQWPASSGVVAIFCLGQHLPPPLFSSSLLPFFPSIPCPFPSPLSNCFPPLSWFPLHFLPPRTANGLGVLPSKILKSCIAVGEL